MYNNTKSQNDDDLSMDEILASIRRYVADEQQQQSQNTIHAAHSTMMRDDIHKQPETVNPLYHQNIQMDQTSPIPVVRLTAAHEIKDDTSGASFDVKQPPKNTTTDSPVPPPSILSPGVVEAAAQSLHRLKETTRSEQHGENNSTSSSSQSVEHFIVSLMKPLIKRWLDENLPSLVERMVQKEIQKITNNLE